MATDFWSSAAGGEEAQLTAIAVGQRGSGSAVGREREIVRERGQCKGSAHKSGIKLDRAESENVLNMIRTRE